MPQEALPDLEHCVSSMGKTRDLDGTVDRVAPPPDEMWPILYCLKRKCEDENIELNSIFEEGGGTHFGVMKMQQFESTLTVNFSRFQFTEDTLQRIRSHYGVGYKVQAASAPFLSAGRTTLQRVVCRARSSPSVPGACPSYRAPGLPNCYPRERTEWPRN